MTGKIRQRRPKLIALAAHFVARTEHTAGLSGDGLERFK
jgi:hypothetical protein